MKFPINKHNVIIVVLGAAILAADLFGALVNSELKTYREGHSPYRYADGKEDEFFPYDEEDAEEIEASAPIKDGETWAIYMYLNASNLELSGHSQLSDYVDYTVKKIVDERQEAEDDAKDARLEEFAATEEANSIPMPLCFYDANYDKGAEKAVPEESTALSEYTWGSDILDEFINVDLPDNFTYVVQPGGATAWGNTQINPNRTRRYVKNGDELKEVYDAPVANMGESETLADFLIFCKENYPADHTMVILTDHGGAMKGFGWDNIYGNDNLTLKELTEAFDMAYGLNEENPPVDLLYYNACLMSNTDVIHSMKGVAEYMIAGEEVGLSLTEYYTKWIEKLADNSDLNAQQLGKLLIDSYVKNLTKEGAILGAPQTSGLCLLDMKKAPKVYDAYADLAGKILADLEDNPDILFRMSRAVQESISFASDSYRAYNCTDLGLWISQIKDEYPAEVDSILSLIDDAVIYKRADNYLKDAKGISVYFPNYIESPASLNLALDYIDNISYSEDISTLYYYKTAGCLNEKYQSYCESGEITIPKNIDYGIMSRLRNISLEAADQKGNVKGNIPEEAVPVLMDVRYELAKVDEKADKLTYYGEDRMVNPDLTNGIETDFDGKWIDIGGVKFAVEVINVTDSYIMYESPVMYKDFEYRMVIKCEIDPETGEDIYTIEGLRSPSDEAATIDRNLVVLRPGSYITPVYNTSEIDGGELTKSTGSTVLYDINTRMGDGELEKGEYRARIVFEDMRGDDVYSEPIYFTVD